MKFLSLTEVLEIHHDQVTRSGGTAGIRDIEPLQSALGMRQATYRSEFLHSDVFDIAAAYLFHLVGKHPFLDVNKRVGAAAALVFLLLHGYDFTAREDDFAQMVLAAARGEIGKPDVSGFIRRWIQAL